VAGNEVGEGQISSFADRRRRAHLRACLQLSGKTRHGDKPAGLIASGTALPWHAGYELSATDHLHALRR